MARLESRAAMQQHHADNHNFPSPHCPVFLDLKISPFQWLQWLAWALNFSDHWSKRSGQCQALPASCELASSINTRQKNSILKLNFSSNAWRVNWHGKCWFLNANCNLIVVLFVENIAIVFNSFPKWGTTIWRQIEIEMITEKDWFQEMECTA